jgi:2-dehydro-3-deoxyphosphooctonate aldolase (KDO 8-P synthase)
MIQSDFFASNNEKLVIIAGPCVLESEEIAFESAQRLKSICESLDLLFIFKSSYDKANRSSILSFRGPGLQRGLRLLAEIRDKFTIPVLTDVHSPEEARAAAEVVDVIQIPAFLCRQTDIIIAASETGKPVNIKKGQFLAPWDVKNIIEKFKSSGNDRITITERGTSFGYNNLVVDFRAFPIMRSFGCPVIFDVTHSLQLPGGQGTSSGGQREFAPALARAAVSVGVDGLFMEVHPDPDRALCDGPNMIKLDNLPRMLSLIKTIHTITHEALKDESAE